MSGTRRDVAAMARLIDRGYAVEHPDHSVTLYRSRRQAARARRDLPGADETRTPPAPPIRARRAGLETDSRGLPAIQARPKRSPGRWAGVLRWATPYLIILAVAISGALSLKGLS